MTNTLANVECGCGKMFTKRGIKIHKCNKKPEEFSCPYCEKEFTSELYLFNHECEQKRRHLQIKEKVNVQAFRAYEWWYKQTYGRQKTYNNFCKSSFYNAFIKRTLTEIVICFLSSICLFIPPFICSECLNIYFFFYLKMSSFLFAFMVEQ